MYALKTLVDQKFRFIITALGVALCVILVHFLLGIYKGVADGSLAYVRSSTADLWVLQKHTNNILRSTSMIRTSRIGDIEAIPGIAAVSPQVLIMGSIEVSKKPQTAYLIGYDAETGMGGPPSIVQGRLLRSDDEIILDRSFAAKYKVKLGDTVQIKKHSLKVVGLSDGTNVFVIQYAFVTLNRAFRVINFGGVVSCLQVKLTAGTSVQQAKGAIEREVSDIVVFDRATFLENNREEMNSGILPLLFVIALLGTVVLTAILSLILSINVLERRKDFAVMKALGAPRGFVSGMVVIQSLALSFSGLLIGLLLFFPLMGLVEKIVPEVSVHTSVQYVLWIVMGVALIGLISSLYPISKIKHIYPMEVFQ